MKKLTILIMLSLSLLSGTVSKTAQVETGLSVVRNYIPRRLNVNPDDQIINETLQDFHKGNPKLSRAGKIFYILVLRPLFKATQDPEDHDAYIINYMEAAALYKATQRLGTIKEQAEAKNRLDKRRNKVETKLKQLKIKNPHRGHKLRRYFMIKAVNNLRKKIKAATTARKVDYSTDGDAISAALEIIDCYLLGELSLLELFNSETL